MQILHTFELGGSERLACELAKRLDPARLRPSLCALDVGGPLALELGSRAIPHWVLGRRPGFDWRLVPRIFRLVRRERPRVVQTHHLTPLIYAAIAARAAGARVVHVEHEQFSIGRPAALGRLRRLTRLCDRVVAAGSGVARFLVERAAVTAARVAVIRNGVDVRVCAPAVRVPRAAFGLAEGEPLIGHVARLEAEKDQATLLRAFQVLARRRPSLRLVVVGKGSLEPELRAQAASLGVAGQVTFLGARSDVPALLPHVDVFALSSVREGLPLTVLEAMACGRPVVATAVGEVPDAIVPGVTGLLVPPGDAGALAAALSEVLDDRARAGAMGRAGRERAESEFNLDHMVEAYERVWRSVRGWGRHD
jgi:sugar transferase (PEP-CTERM/EpsH1 system associated)